MALYQSTTSRPGLEKISHPDAERVSSQTEPVFNRQRATVCFRVCSYLMQKKSRHAEIENSRRSRLSPTLSASNECVPRSAVSSQQLVWSMIRPGRCPEVQAREKI